MRNNAENRYHITSILVQRAIICKTGYGKTVEVCPVSGREAKPFGWSTMKPEGFFMSAVARQSDLEHAGMASPVLSDQEARRRLREAVRIYVTGALRAAAKEQMGLAPDGGNLDCDNRQSSGADDSPGVTRKGGDR